MSHLWINQEGNISCDKYLPEGDAFKYQHWIVYSESKVEGPDGECQECLPRVKNRTYSLDPSYPGENGKKIFHSLIGKAIINIREATLEEMRILNTSIYNLGNNIVIELSDGSLIFSPAYSLSVKF